MSEEIIKVPDIGSGSAEVIEISVNSGDVIEADDSLVILESDKATMEVPAPKAGKVTDIMLNVGDKVTEGDDLLKLLVEAETTNNEPVRGVQSEVPTTLEPISTPTVSETVVELKLASINVPDIGAENVPVIEICVAVGDTIAKEDALVVLESDKATMEVPAPMAGVVKSITVNEGDKVNEGDLILELETSDSNAANTNPSTTPTTATESTIQAPSPAAENKSSTKPVDSASLKKTNRQFHAGPAVRKLAREFGVDLAQVKGSGPRSRIIKEDVQNYVKTSLTGSNGGHSATGSGIPQMPAIDFSQWGTVEEKPLTRLRTIAAQNFQRSWLNVPHVTQFDDADITELEEFRKSQKSVAEARNTKLTPLPFILKACAYVLQELPQFCASLSPDGKSLIYKQYINIGVAVDTPDGLLVPVIKNADKKNLLELAEECIELAGKARSKKLQPAEMQGGCFTISSLGAIGGTSFTPIVNAPEVAILGLSKASMKPVWNGKDFTARLILPLSLSYDHRAINGADAARFTVILGTVLGDIRKILL